MAASLSLLGSCWEPEVSRNPRIYLWVHIPTWSPDTRAGDMVTRSPEGSSGCEPFLPYPV